MLKVSNLVIWFNPNNNVYYYKIVRFYNQYDVGFKNNYGHIVCLVIPVTFKIKRGRLSKRLIKRLISFLEKFL